MAYKLPAKVPVFLKRLHAEYETDRPQLAALIAASRFSVAEGTGHDDWGEGTDLHTVTLFLPTAALTKVKIQQQASLADKIREDLNACATGYPSEAFAGVILEIEDQNDPVFQKAQPYASEPTIEPNSLTIWRPGEVRLFITHRDGNKAEAHSLAEALEPYGVSAFVAHDTIQPMTTWKDEIMNGLRTMEVMLALITDDFEASFWTQQEVGFALARGVPIIPLKVGRKDPPGFISSTQALKGQLNNLAASASDVYAVLADKLGNRTRLQGALVTSFATATNFPAVIERFDRLSEVATRLTDDEFLEIKAAFASNNQLHGCIYLVNHNNRLKRFLEEATGKSVTIAGTDIITADDLF